MESLRCSAVAIPFRNPSVRTSRISSRRVSIRRPYQGFRPSNLVFLRTGFSPHSWKVVCEATGNGRDFQGQANRAVDNARRRWEEAAKSVSAVAGKTFQQAKRKVADFQKDLDLQTKLNRAAQAAILKLEEITFDLKRVATRIDRDYQIRAKARSAYDYASEQVQTADRQLGAGRKAKEITADLRAKWPAYRKQISNFLDTPVGRFVATVFLLWLLISGWFFRLLLLSLWVVPFLPMLISKVGKAAIVQGTCPNCGMQYVGGRNQIVMCSRCRGCSLAAESRLFKRS